MKARYLELDRPTCAGGFPPDYVFWGHKKDLGTLEFSGSWSKSRKGESSACIHEAFSQSWEWKETTNSKVTKPYHSPDVVYTSPEGVKYKVVGFRDTGGYTYVENTWHPWTGASEQVTHKRDSHVLVVEIVEDLRK